MPRTRKPFILTGVVAGPILISLIALVAIVLQPTSDSGAQATHKLFVPAAGCDSCEPQPVRLYYLGMRQDVAPMNDGRVRRAVWDTTDTRLLAEGPAAVNANVGVAWSVINPDREESYVDPLFGSVTACDNFLWLAGYPTKQDARRLVLFVDVVDNDPIAAELAQALNKQWLRCEVGLEPVFHSPVEFAQLLATGLSKAFITTIDTRSSEPFGLLHRLFDTNSPENYTDVVPATAANSIQPLLDQAKAATNPASAASLYSDISRRVNGYPIVDYLNVMPLVWRYDFDGYQPPLVTLEGNPFLLLNKSRDTLAISAKVSSGRPGTEIKGVSIDWGDGTRETVTLPASHTYAPVSQPTFMGIVVSVRQSDGTVTWRARWVSQSP